MQDVEKEKKRRLSECIVENKRRGKSIKSQQEKGELMYLSAERVKGVGNWLQSPASQK